VRIRGEIARVEGGGAGGLGIRVFLVQGYRMPMFIVIRRKQDALSFRLRTGSSKGGNGE